MPLRGLFGPVEWLFVGLLVLNVVLFAAIVVQREQWLLHERMRGRVRRRLAPVARRLLEEGDVKRVAEELRRVIAGLGAESRPVAAWLVLDGLGGADAGTRDAVSRVLEECGAVAVAERATRRRAPWRRALACEFLGTIGTEHSVGVLVARLRDRRAEVRMAAASALGRLGHPAAAQPLSELFLRPGSVPMGVLSDALRGLGAAGGDAFRRGLGSPEPTVRVTSCFGIADLADGDREGTLALLAQRVGADPEPRVRSAAVSAMRWLPGRAAPAALLAALADPAPAVRRSVAASLGAFDDPAAVEALAGAVCDLDREIAVRSAESLLALSGGVRAGEPARRVLDASRAWAVDSVTAEAELRA